MNDHNKNSTSKKSTKNPLKLPTNDEPWGPQPAKKTVLLADKAERYLQGKGSNELEVKVM